MTSPAPLTPATKPAKMACMETSLLVGKTHREVVLGKRGGIHIAHPLSDVTLCGRAIGERPGIDAFGRGKMRDGVYLHGVNACRECVGLTYAGGNESRQVGAYA